MNILVLSENYYPNEVGGFELACRRFVDRIGNAAEVHVLTSSCRSKEKVPCVQYIYKKTTDFPWDFQRNKLLAALVRAFVARFNYYKTLKYLKQFDVDVVLAYKLDNTTFSPLVACQKKKLPIVLDMGDLWWKFVSDNFQKRGLARAKKWLSYGMFMPSQVKPRCIVCNSQYMKSEMSSVFNGRIPIIHCFLPDFMCGKPLDKVANLDVVRIFFGGRICPEKGLDNFVEIIHLLRKRKTKLKIDALIMGDGDPDYIRSIKRLIESYGLEDMISLNPGASQEEFFSRMRQYHFFLFPFNWHEPFGQVVSQSMVAGAVPLCSNRGGPAEVVSDGINGYLIPPTDHGRYADVIIDMVSDVDRYNKIRSNAWEYANDSFGPDVIVDNYKKVLEDYAR